MKVISNTEMLIEEWDCKISSIRSMRSLQGLRGVHWWDGFKIFPHRLTIPQKASIGIEVEFGGPSYDDAKLRIQKRTARNLHDVLQLENW
jgi:hypothetical protein